MTACTVPVADNTALAVPPATLVNRAPLLENAVSPVPTATERVPVIGPGREGANDTLAWHRSVAAMLMAQLVESMTKSGLVVSAPMLTGTLPGLKTMKSVGVLCVPRSAAP